MSSNTANNTTAHNTNGQHAAAAQQAAALPGAPASSAAAPDAASVAAARSALSKVRTWHFNPFCRNVAEARAWLLAGAAPTSIATLATATATAADHPTSCTVAAGNTTHDTNTNDLHNNNTDNKNTATAPQLAAMEGHAAACGGFAVVCHGAARGVEVVPLAGIEPSFFLNTAALGDAADGIAQRIDREAALQAFRGWDVEVCAPGSVFRTDMTDGGICAFVTTKKTGDSYFDFVLYSGDGAASAYYSKKDGLPGLRHSGDVGSLLHYVKAQDAGLARGQPVALGVVGYQLKPLRTFATQLPAVCIPCREERVVRIVPCPLDEASVGDHTMACIATVTRVGASELQFAVSSRPATASGVDTAHINETTCGVVAEALADAARAVATHEAAEVAAAAAQLAAGPATAAASAPAMPATGSHTADVADRDDCCADAATTAAAAALPQAPLPERVVLVEAALADDAATTAAPATGPGADGTLRVTFGAGIGTPRAGGDESAVTLPCVAGSCSGAAALALGTPFALQEQQPPLAPRRYAEALQRAALTVVHVSDGMLESAAATAHAQLNAVFVVHPRRTLSTKPCVPGQAPTEAALCDVNVSAVAALAGPLSMVVVQLPAAGAAGGHAAGPRRYWYRGVAWPGVIDAAAATFGADVTAELGDARLLALQRGGFEAPPRPVHARGCAEPVLFGGRYVAPAAVAASVTGSALHELAARRADIERALAQLQVVLAPGDLEPLVRGMAEHLASAAERHTRGPKAQLVEAVAAGREPATIAELSARLARATREATSQVQWLVDAVGACMSVRGTATRRHELARLQRKVAISKNVEAAKSMTLDDVAGLLEAACAEGNAALVAHVDAPALQRCLQAVSPGMMEQRYCAAAPGLGGLVVIEPRLACIDCFTAGALLENAAAVAPTPLSNRNYTQPPPPAGADVDGDDDGLFGEVPTMPPAAPPTQASYAPPPQPKAGEVSLAICGIDCAPAVPVPLLARFVDMTEPERVSWLAECNESDVARLRILMRGTLSQCVAARSHSIPPQARDLGWALVDLLLQAAEGAVANAGGGGGAGTLSFGDSLAQTVRGVLGLVLTTLASGATPLSKAWQLVSRAELPVLPEQRLHWWVYARLAALFRFACWEPAVFLRNARHLCCDALHRFGVHPRASGKAAAASAAKPAAGAGRRGTKTPAPGSEAARPGFVVLDGADAAEALARLRESTDAALRAAAAAVGAPRVAALEALAAAVAGPAQQPAARLMAAVLGGAALDTRAVQELEVLWDSAALGVAAGPDASLRATVLGMVRHEALSMTGARPASPVPVLGSAPALPGTGAASAAATAGGAYATALVGKGGGAAATKPPARKRAPRTEGAPAAAAAPQPAPPAAVVAAPVGAYAKALMAAPATAPAGAPTPAGAHAAAAAAAAAVPGPGAAAWGAPPRRCFSCGQAGHVAAACPNGGAEGVRTCFRCHGKGHIAANCTRRRKPAGKKQHSGGAAGAGQPKA